MLYNRKIIIMILTLAVFISPYTLVGTADEGIDKTMQEWFQAVKRGDSAALASLVTEDAEFWTNGAAPIKGRNALKQAFDTFFSQYNSEQRLVEIERRVFEKWAFIRGEEINILTPKAGGKSIEYRQRIFSVMHLDTDGRWRFARGMSNTGPSDKK